MYNDLLPPRVHEFLDNFESSLCLPILIILVLCTFHFIINHVFDIGCSIASAMEGGRVEMDLDLDESPCQPLATKIKGMFYNAACTMIPGESVNAQTSTPLFSPLPNGRRSNAKRGETRT
ncbi:uncharacterized protein [Fopius arisanus]|uniref:Uncharacterized protein n=1 Tax=Fopius arisanus TaxID=64838 RepID=A0A9R1U384_9HYME|nr:PREDICTED: uncharacterized protein LOC105268232 [Fopius arisanus]